MATLFSIGRQADPSQPHVVLLHGYPTSSHMYRHLIPLLADRYHVVAPDFLGFGLSDAPQVADFNYSFDSLAAITAALLVRLGIDRYAMYVQDYGAPVGWRLAIRDPRSVTAVISQNGNAYSEGFVDRVLGTDLELRCRTKPGQRGGLTICLHIGRHQVAVHARRS